MAKENKGRTKQEQGQASLVSKIWLAGLGALAEAEEQGDKFFKSLVKKGRAYEPTLKEPFESVGEAFRSSVDAASNKASEGFKELEGAIDRALTSAMKKAGIASRKEVEALRKEVVKLRQQVKKRATKKAGPQGDATKES
ncbi:MAG TPA: phasin family protein [Vicinamibacteria bacterium]|nr:phasin family protein [Vicinamibacteria bacterium]